MTTRFNRQLVVHATTSLAEAIRRHEGFDLGNGTSQLRPKKLPTNQAQLDDLIDRAVEYGRMLALYQVSGDSHTNFRSWAGVDND